MSDNDHGAAWYVAYPGRLLGALVGYLIAQAIRRSFREVVGGGTWVG